MQLHLIDGRDDLHVLTEVGQDRRIEVRYADCLGQPIAISFFDTAVCSEIITHRLMQQDEIHIEQIQSGQRCLDRFIGRLLCLLILDPHLGGDEQLFPGGQTIRDGSRHPFAQCFFVHVCRRGIQQTIPGLDGIVDDLFTLLRIRDLEDAESFQRHFRTCVQC